MLPRKIELATWESVPHRVNNLKRSLEIIYGTRLQVIPHYVLDGHARCIRARQLGSETIQAMILQPEVHVNFGIIKTAHEMRLKSLDDISIFKDAH